MWSEVLENYGPNVNFNKKMKVKKQKNQKTNNLKF